MSTQYRLIRSIECVLVPQVMISSDFTFTSGVWLPASYEPPILEWRLFLFTGKDIRVKIYVCQSRWKSRLARSAGRWNTRGWRLIMIILPQ
jgi:hypothetical protein